MPERNDAALAFLQSRRSRPAKTLIAPAPSRDELMPLLQAAARTPDHGKLEPWRFIVVERGAMARLADLTTKTGERLQKSPEDIAKARTQFELGQLAVVVVEIQKDSPKIPPIEQSYSAGAVCLALLNAALAAGWGANWLSGWASHDPIFCREAFDLAENERIAGLIHIATEGSVPPERPRPDLAAITTWVET
ncbi:MAG: nitroreductase family protein [Phaeobacter italicus]|jgi:nitroreductase|uniref:nitroreductase family protein n=1 Tax=Phaeobacter italicus TaxID=481446 RepID=UPI000619CD41|nr:nitroreductase family protein [Phaeobacter italicus]MBO9441699.1 nitroreductase family protein [Phaeobacter italicus]MBY5976574.1 nitroreductase family protein [Phaeobacter italicus]MCA0855439.1 nitroreductase family protein [Phaeobacter italicus]MCI5099755.1 nitroreductase family protein [Phaeobacter italicus]GLO73730.1 nitroreductase [Phaeobacter italicus]